MPDISSIGHGPIGPVNRAPGSGAHQAQPKARQTVEPRGDRVELSQLARLMDRLRQLPEVRGDLVDRIRLEIALGIYETPEKVEQAVDRLLEELRE